MQEEKKRKSCIFHIDMDAFYVSVETLLNPKLKGKAVVVGTDSPRGVVAAASYEARKYGVFSAMSCVKAKQLCPHLIFVSSGRKHYIETSEKVMNCIQSYSPLVEVVGLDEAYLDASGMDLLYESPYAMAKALQEDIRLTTNGLTCSIGIAPLRFLAKIASDLNKPYGIAQIQEEEIHTFLKNMDLYKIPSVGKKFLKELHSIGMKTAGDVQKYNKDFLENRFGKQGLMLYERVHGIDNTPITPYREPKSESAELTLSEDTRNIPILKEYLEQHAQRVALNLREKRKKASVVTLKIKYADFKQVTRQLSLSVPTSSAKTLYEAACYLLDKEILTQAVRLIGLGASQFDMRIKEEQLQLLDISCLKKSEEFDNSFDNKVEQEMQREKLDTTLDRIKKKYGSNILKSF